MPEEQTAEIQTTSRLLLADLYSAGIIRSKMSILESFNKQVSLEGQTLVVDAINSETDLKAGGLIDLLSNTGVALNRAGLSALHELLGLFIVSNLSIDEPETLRRKAEARSGVPKIKKILF